MKAGSLCCTLVSAASSIIENLVFKYFLAGPTTKDCTVWMLAANGQSRTAVKATLTESGYLSTRDGGARPSPGQCERTSAR
jgi:hypothetical protein